MALTRSKKTVYIKMNMTYGDFYYLNYLHLFRTKNKLKSHEKVCRSKYICGIIKSSENDYILEFNQYMNLYKIPYNVYADNESLIKK